MLKLQLCKEFNLNHKNTQYLPWYVFKLHLLSCNGLLKCCCLHQVPIVVFCIFFIYLGICKDYHAAVYMVYCHSETGSEDMPQRVGHMLFVICLGLADSIPCV